MICGQLSNRLITLFTQPKLLRVYNNLVNSIGKKKLAALVLDLSSVFDTSGRDIFLS